MNIYKNLHKSKTYNSDLNTAIKHTIGIEKLKGSRILITGATGTIGSFVADMLFKNNQENDANTSVLVAGRDMDQLNSMYGTFEGFTALTYNLEEKIKFDVPVDYMIHCAGNAHPAAFNSDPVGTIVGNINSTYNLLEYGRTHGTARLLYVSSGEVYGQGDTELEEFEETYAGYLNIQSPRSCYPSSKRTAENLCASYSRQYGLETVVVRPCHTYGPWITSSDNRANVQFMNNVLNSEDIVMKSAGDQMRSYNYVADCASALLTVLINGNSGEAYNLANPECRVTIAEFADIVARTANRKVVFETPDSADIANRSPIARQVLATGKIEALGWKGNFSVQRGVQHTIDILCGK